MSYNHPIQSPSINVKNTIIRFAVMLLLIIIMYILIYPIFFLNVLWHEFMHIAIGVLSGGTFAGISINYLTLVPWCMSGLTTINNNPQGVLRVFGGIISGLLLIPLIIIIQQIYLHYVKQDNFLSIFFYYIMEFIIFWAGLVTYTQATYGADTPSDLGELARALVPVPSLSQQFQIFCLFFAFIGAVIVIYLLINWTIKVRSIIGKTDKAKVVNNYAIMASTILISALISFAPYFFMPSIYLIISNFIAPLSFLIIASLLIYCHITVSIKIVTIYY